jgi:Glyoxalase/Bleomycin resistance protein/Dioxygenase superfamily
MSTLETIELKTFVPAKDFELSKSFYTELGFDLRSEFADIAYFCVGSCAFLLQNFYRPAHATNMVMHLLVEDVQAWFDKVAACDFPTRYKHLGVRITPLQTQAWGMTEFVLIDPSGVCWHIAQNTPSFKPVGRLPNATDTP